MKQQIRVFLLLIIFCTLCVACGGGGTTTQTPTPTIATVNLNVFAAASLTESFKALAVQYQKVHPDIIIKYNFAGSSTLETADRQWRTCRRFCFC